MTRRTSRKRISLRPNFTATPRDRKVVMAFLDKRAADSKKLWTDGKRLDGLWMGGRGIAEWIGDEIVFSGYFNKHGEWHHSDPPSRSVQTIQNMIRREAPKNWLKPNSLEPAPIVLAEITRLEKRLKSERNLLMRAKLKEAVRRLQKHVQPNARRRTSRGRSARRSSRRVCCASLRRNSIDFPTRTLDAAEAHRIDPHYYEILRQIVKMTGRKAISFIQRSSRIDPFYADQLNRVIKMVGRDKVLDVLHSEVKKVYGK